MYITCTTIIMGDTNKLLLCVDKRLTALRPLAIALLAVLTVSPACTS